MGAGWRGYKLEAQGLPGHGMLTPPRAGPSASFRLCPGPRGVGAPLSTWAAGNELVGVNQPGLFQPNLDMAPGHQSHLCEGTHRAGQS
jgi:hypothetical protein